jgi:putative transposase
VALEDRRKWIDPEQIGLSVSRQCALAGPARSCYYYEPGEAESSENEALMRQIDRLYLRRPFYWSPRMTDWLGEYGWQVNVKRVARLMRVMGLQSVLPKPYTSRPHPENRVYPYLLRGLAIRAPKRVWCADITYIPLRSSDELYSPFSDRRRSGAEFQPTLQKWSAWGNITKRGKQEQKRRWIQKTISYSNRKTVQPMGGQISCG